jgi:4-oxalocrotonate tautomerase
MPTIFVNILEGKTQEQKDALVKKITEAAVQTVDVVPEKVSVFIHEYSSNSVARGGVMYDKR